MDVAVMETSSPANRAYEQASKHRAEAGTHEAAADTHRMADRMELSEAHRDHAMLHGHAAQEWEKAANNHSKVENGELARLDIARDHEKRAKAKEEEIEAHYEGIKDRESKLREHGEEPHKLEEDADKLSEEAKRARAHAERAEHHEEHLYEAEKAGDGDLRDAHKDLAFRHRKAHFHLTRATEAMANGHPKEGDLVQLHLGAASDEENEINRFKDNGKTLAAYIAKQREAAEG